MGVHNNWDDIRVTTRVCAASGGCLSSRPTASTRCWWISAKSLAVSNTRTRTPNRAGHIGAIIAVGQLLA